MHLNEVISCLTQKSFRMINLNYEPTATVDLMDRKFVLAYLSPYISVRFYCIGCVVLPDGIFE